MREKGEFLPEIVLRNGGYQDKGCDLAPKCLECPLPACRYDLPPQVAGTILRTRQVRALLDQGKTRRETAEELGLSIRTVARLKKLS